MPAETLPLDDAPMLPPLVLRPPLGPRVLRGMVLALAAIFHVLTAGWNQIANGREGDIAGAARLLSLERGWFPSFSSGIESPSGPLAVWLSKGSMNLLGIDEFGARLPAALGAVAMIWVVMRLGECFGGTWRGFVAGMLLLCTPGMFTLGRTLSAAPLEAAFVATVFLCLVRGYQHRSGRRQWFFLGWLALACAFFTGGVIPVVMVVSTVLVLAVFYRKARLRFRSALSWEAALVIALAAAGAAACGFVDVTSTIPTPDAGRIIAGQAALLFPWSLLLLPSAGVVIVRLALGRPLEWGEAFPLVWLGVGLAVILLFPTGSLFDTLMIWPAVALWGARALEILSRRSFLRGCAAVFALAGSSLVLTGRIKEGLVGMFPAIADFINGIPAFFWPSVASVVFIALLAFALFAAVAFALDLSHHRRFAVIALFGAMLPSGYAFVDIAAKLAPYFSYAEIARCVNDSHAEKQDIAVDGTRFGASSLLFYLDPSSLPFEIAPDPANRNAVAALLAENRKTVLITRRTRLALWDKASDPRKLQIECESGGSLLLKPSVTPP